MATIPGSGHNPTGITNMDMNFDNPILSGLLSGKALQGDNWSGGSGKGTGGNMYSPTSASTWGHIVNFGKGYGGSNTSGLGGVPNAGSYYGTAGMGSMPGFSANGPMPGAGAGLPTPGVAGGWTPTQLSGNTAQAYNLGLGNALTDVYGEFAPTLYQYLMTGAGYNPQVAQGIVNQLYPDYQRGMASLYDSFGDAGLRYSSTAALGAADYGDRFLRNVGALQSQYYQSAQDRYMNMLLNLMGGQQESYAGKTNPMDYLNMALQIGTSIAGMF